MLANYISFQLKAYYRYSLKTWLFNFVYIHFCFYFSPRKNSPPIKVRRRIKAVDCRRLWDCLISQLRLLIRKGLCSWYRWVSLFVLMDSSGIQNAWMSFTGLSHTTSWTEVTFLTDAATWLQEQSKLIPKTTDTWVSHILILSCQLRCAHLLFHPSEVVPSISFTAGCVCAQEWQALCWPQLHG